MCYHNRILWDKPILYNNCKGGINEIIQDYNCMIIDFYDSKAFEKI